MLSVCSNCLPRRLCQQLWVETRLPKCSSSAFAKPSLGGFCLCLPTVTPLACLEPTRLRDTSTAGNLMDQHRLYWQILSFTPRKSQFRGLSSFFVVEGRL